jgi:2-furoate---CoA ligase
LSGFVMTPVNWRAKSAEIDYFLADAEAAALVYQDICGEAVTAAPRSSTVLKIGVGDCAVPGSLPFQSLLGEKGVVPAPCPDPQAISVMLYTSGTTGRPKGVPRRHYAERAAAIAHVLQNFYEREEATLGVMPLYHTMGVRSLISMSLVGGTFICMPRFTAPAALRLITEERVSCLYLVPILYHDLLEELERAGGNVTPVRKIGFAGASMTDGLLARVESAFRPQWFVNHYGSTEIYTITVNQQAAQKPGSAGKAGINQSVRVVRLHATDPDDVVQPGVEGQIIAMMNGDEAFDGYWRRPEADARAIQAGWYFTGDTGYIDASGDLFITGRADDLIISGGENISPQEVESCLSLHAGVSEVAVFGLPDARWGQVVAAAIVRRGDASAESLDVHCKSSGLANFKRPRRYLFVKTIPQSPVGKILRRALVAGDYEPDGSNEVDLTPQA